MHTLYTYYYIVLHRSNTNERNACQMTRQCHISGIKIHIPNKRTWSSIKWSTSRSKAGTLFCLCRIRDISYHILILKLRSCCDMIRILQVVIFSLNVATTTTSQSYRTNIAGHIWPSSFLPDESCLSILLFTC